MNICVSQLSHPDLNALLKFLKSIEIENIELVLSKIKPWQELNEHHISALRTQLDVAKIKAPSIQSLFYGLNYSLNDIDSILDHFQILIEHARILGTNKLVFGSPNLRKKVDSYEELLQTIFTELDLMLDDTGVQVAIEPNCTVYGGEFFLTVPEIVEFLDKYSFQNIVTMLDFHNVKNEGMNPCKVFEEYQSRIKHIHVSEPGLVGIVDKAEHQEFSDTIARLGYDGVVTYEIMHNDAIFDQIGIFKQLYG